MDTELANDDAEVKEGTGKATVMLLVLAGLFLLSVYYGKPVLERLSEKISGKKSVEESQEALDSDSDVFPLTGIEALRPQIVDALKSFERSDVEIVFMGVHQEIEEAAIDYHVKGGDVVKEAFCYKDDYGRYVLKVGDGEQSIKIYPPKGFKGIR